MEVVALHRAHHRQRRTGAAAGELDDAHARPQGATPFGAFDHRERHSVFVRPGRIEVFELDDDVGGSRRDEPAAAARAACGRLSAALNQRVWAM